MAGTSVKALLQVERGQWISISKVRVKEVRFSHYSLNRGKPLAIAIYCRAYTSNVVSDNLNNTANWSELLEKACHSSINTTIGNKAKEISDSLMHHVQLWYQSSPDLQGVVVPIGGTLLGTLLAWFAIPVSFLQFHKYMSWNPVLAFLGLTTKIEVPYENSMWNALEDPVKYLVVFMAFSQM